MEVREAIKQTKPEVFFLTNIPYKYKLQGFSSFQYGRKPSQKVSIPLFLSLYKKM